MEEPLDHFDENPNQLEDLGIGWKILAFLIPLAGAIMYFNHKSTNPKKSQSACYAALFGIGLNIILNLMGAAMGAG